MDYSKLTTPCFVLNTEEIEEQATLITSQLRAFWPNGIVGYSFKTNNLPWLISLMKDNELFAEVVSSDEYILAKELGFPVNNIIFNGPAKTYDCFVDALSGGAIVNLDAEREVRWLQQSDCKTRANCKVGLRVNFDLEALCPNESQGGAEDGRFGFSCENGRLSEIISLLHKEGIKMSGLHLHCSSKTRSPNIYRAIAETAVNIVKHHQLRLDYIDIGGGFFGGMPGRPSFHDYFEQTKEIFDKEELLHNTNVIIEPGMAIVGAYVDYITSVIDVKKTLHNYFVLLDGSRTHIDPLMKKADIVTPSTSPALPQPPPCRKSYVGLLAWREIASSPITVNHYPRVTWLCSTKWAHTPWGCPRNSSSSIPQSMPSKKMNP